MNYRIVKTGITMLKDGETEKYRVQKKVLYTAKKDQDNLFCRSRRNSLVISLIGSFAGVA